MSPTEVSCITSRRTGRIVASTRVCALTWQCASVQTKANVGTGTGWVNTEYRTYEFTKEVHTDDLEGYELDGDNATLVETIESRERRGKSGPMPDREQQKMLYEKGTQGWDDQGLQLSIAEREAAKVPEGTEVDGVRV